MDTTKNGINLQPYPLGAFPPQNVYLSVFDAYILYLMDTQNNLQSFYISTILLTKHAFNFGRSIRVYYKIDEVTNGIHDFRNINSANYSPLAKQLFDVPGVQQVFYGDTYITVTKTEDTEWPVLTQNVQDVIQNYLKSGQNILDQDLLQQKQKEEEKQYEGEDEEIVLMIKELLDTRIRPVVNDDGGDVQFREWDPNTGIVYLKMQGACSGCPSSWGTLKNGVEEMLKHYIEEVQSVQEAEPEEYELQGIEEFNNLEKQLSN